MKRSELIRYTPLRTYTPLRSKTPIRKVNPARKKRLMERQYGISFGYDAFIRSLCCAVPGCPRDERFTVFAHADKTRGAWGSWRHGGPLCFVHETHFHSMGRWSFAAKYGVDMRQVARDCVRMWIAKRREEHGD